MQNEGQCLSSGNLVGPTPEGTAGWGGVGIWGEEGTVAWGGFGVRMEQWDGEDLG